MSRIATFCADYIGKHGPASVDELHKAAHAAKVTTARTPSGVTQAVRRSELFAQLPDGRYTTARLLLAGSVFTHRVRVEGEGAGYVLAGTELDPLRPLMDERGDLPLEGGGSVWINPHWSSGWKIPEGVVERVSVGDLIGFRWTGTHLQIERVAYDPVKDLHRADEVRFMLVRHRRLRLKRQSRGYSYYNGQSDDVARLVLAAVAEAPTLFAAPVPPLDELLGPSPSECLNELYRSLEDVLQRVRRVSVSLDLPAPLYAAVVSRADRLDVSPSEFITGLLGHEMWRTSPTEELLHTPRYDTTERRLHAVPDWESGEWPVPDVP